MTPNMSLADQIALELRADIISGRLLPGMALVEADLVTAYSASRNTIREALHRLGQEGLTRYVRNKGVMVRRLEREESSRSVCCPPHTGIAGHRTRQSVDGRSF